MTSHLAMVEGVEPSSEYPQPYTLQNSTLLYLHHKLGRSVWSQVYKATFLTYYFSCQYWVFHTCTTSSATVSGRRYTRPPRRMTTLASSKARHTWSASARPSAAPLHSLASGLMLGLCVLLGDTAGSAPSGHGLPPAGSTVQQPIHPSPAEGLRAEPCVQSSTRPADPRCDAL